MQAFSQTTIKGFIHDSISKEPVPYATVYINGTTRGTTSDENGYFILDKVILPGKLVVSHINYKTITYEYLQETIKTINLNIELAPAIQLLSDITVTSKKNRKLALKYFEKTFFGENKWGDYAFLRNDDALFFRSSAFIKYKPRMMTESIRPDTFIVEASVPLVVDLPLLGYEMYIDLQKFSVIRVQNQYSYKTTCDAYVYFKPVDINSENKRDKIEKNRKSVYYNSVRHFLLSLYDNHLKENGYYILVKPRLFKEFSEDEFMNEHIKIHDQYIEFTDCLDDTMYILYYADAKGEPLNLNTYDKHDKPILTSVFFTKDTCSILLNGVQPEHSIYFGSEIGNKKAGTWLPYEYAPGVLRNRHSTSFE